MKDMFAEIKPSIEEITKWGVAHLTEVIAIDSQSDEDSDAIPSSEGQRVLSAHLESFFHGLGVETETDAYANLIAHLPARHVDGKEVPAIALMVHLDTSKGTFPIPALLERPAWDGGRIDYPENDRLQVSLEVYPQTECFLGEDLLHGTGVSPIGLDDKLGMAQLMTLAKVLRESPDIPHGDIFLVFRPDEEIGRMEAVEGLADAFASKGIRYGYTVDGLDPFEINVENFNASRGCVDIVGEVLSFSSSAETRLVELSVWGVKSHGATAKAEGYRNATIWLAEVMSLLGEREDIIPVGFESDPVAEVNAQVCFWLRGADEAALDALERTLLAAWEEVVAPHRLRGADASVVRREPVAKDAVASDEFVQLVAHLQAFLKTPGVSPLLSEESDGYEGYTNPYFVSVTGPHALQLNYRLRAFTPEELEARGRHLQKVCEADHTGRIKLKIEPQYINMGPEMAKYPELVEWAKAAAEACEVTPKLRPIRGGTGVDPFLARGIPIANLGTGYFAPESEKEFTSKQKLAQHVLWLVRLVQVIAAG